MATAYVIFPDGWRCRAEVADTDDARLRGLMFRESLPDEDGLLLAFERPDRYGIWMKNVRVPLDILWLDARGRVVWMVEAAPPCPSDPCAIYTPPGRAVFVLEVPAGVARGHGAAVRGRVEIRLP